MNFREYLESRNYSNATIESYEKMLVLFTDWIRDEQLKVKDMTYNDMMAYVRYASSKGISKRYVQIQLTVIRHYFNFLIKTKKVKDNIAANINIKGVRKRLPHDLLNAEELEAVYKGYPVVGLVGRRNKVILGLMVYQGLATEDLAKLEEPHLKLREGKIYIPARRRSNSRTLDLQGHQVLDLQEYIKRTRMLILELAEKESKALFTSIGKSERFSNMQARMLKNIQNYMPQVKSLQQIRNSVIAEWVKKHNLREAQYLAGHRYVSSTEMYQQSNIDDLKKDVQSFHPFTAKP
jgi:site-specific recombinase XerD